MDLYRPSHLLQFLDEYNLRPNKTLSQNFLIDQNILDKIVALAELSPKDLAVEIGPGPGGLTQKLLKIGCPVVAIEKDKGFAQALARFENPNLKIRNEDALQSSFFENAPQKMKVIANLPYNITAPILTKLVALSEQIGKIVVMVQKEVAVRICSPHDCKDYSSLSVFIQLHGEASFGFKVSRNCFFPAPKVESAVITITPKHHEYPDELFVMVRTAFQQKRKMLKASLCTLYEKQDIEDALTAIGHQPTARPHNLPPVDFARLFERLQKK